MVCAWEVERKSARRYSFQLRIITKSVVAARPARDSGRTALVGEPAHLEHARAPRRERLDSVPYPHRFGRLDVLVNNAGFNKIEPVAEMALLMQIEVVLTPIWVWLGVGEVPRAATLIEGRGVLIKSDDPRLRAQKSGVVFAP